MSTGRLVATAHCLVFISLKLPTILFPSTTAFLARCLIALSLHVLALLALAIAAQGIKQSTTQAQITEYEIRKGARDVLPDVRHLGCIAAGYTLVLAYLTPEGTHTLAEGFIRVACFFIACKIVDVAVLRGRVPKLMRLKRRLKERKQVAEKEMEVVELDGWKAKAEYVFRLFTETRYASFDTAIDDQTKRRVWWKENSRTKTLLYAWTPRIVIPMATYFLPIPEMQVLFTLVCIETGLEGLHSVLHPRCPNYLFLAPFAAEGIVDHWGVHWHQGAQSWFISLGYKPAKRFATEILGCGKEVGSAAGVVGAFTLSGLWHGWAAAVFSQAPWSAGIGMFLFFLGQGVGSVIERRIWKNGEGGLVKKVLCWAFAVESAALWLRILLPTLKKDVAWAAHPILTFFNNR